MKKIKNKDNLPWEDDDIEFLKGDWKIQRADCVGLYRYAISGIEGQRAVDAVQLIQWKMAKVCDYPTLHPWPNSDVTFVSDCVIIRDPRDQSSPKGKRRYLMEIDGKIWCVNKYYLVQQGLATYGAKTGKEVSATKISGLKSPEMLAWKEDGIVIVPKSGVKVDKAQSSGMYRITSGGIAVVRSAKFLLQNGYAKRIFDMQIDELAHCEPTTISQVGKDLHGFWYLHDAGTICSLRQIAKLNCQVEQCNAPCVKEILDACIHKEEEIAAISAVLNKCIQQYDEVKSQLEFDVSICLNAFNCEILPFQNAGLLDDCSAFDGNHARFCDLCSVVEKQFRQLYSVVAQLNTLLSQRQKCVTSNIDPTIFPQKVRVMLKKNAEDVQKRVPPWQEIQGAAVMRINQEKDCQDAEKALCKLQKNAREIASKIADVNNHKEKLNKIADELGDKAKQRKTHLFNRTYKPDGIVLITALTVRHTGYGRYKAEGKNGKFLRGLSAEELVYLNLAKYKRGIR